jgi:hypothetical protein
MTFWETLPGISLDVPSEGNTEEGMTAMNLLKMLSKPAAWASGWTSAILCFSAATGYWLANERRRAICWAVLGAVEVSAIVF